MKIDKKIEKLKKGVKEVKKGQKEIAKYIRGMKDIVEEGFKGSKDMIENLIIRQAKKILSEEIEEYKTDFFWYE